MRFRYFTRAKGAKTSVEVTGSEITDKIMMRAIDEAFYGGNGTSFGFHLNDGGMLTIQMTPTAADVTYYPPA